MIDCITTFCAILRGFSGLRHFRYQGFRQRNVLRSLCAFQTRIKDLRGGAPNA